MTESTNTSDNGNTITLTFPRPHSSLVPVGPRQRGSL